MLRIAIATIALVAAAGSAFAQSDSDRQAATMKAKLAKSSSGPVQPTGIEVPGCAYYTLTDRGGVRKHCHLANTRDPAGFYTDYVYRYSHGASQ